MRRPRYEEGHCPGAHAWPPSPEEIPSVTIDPDATSRRPAPAGSQPTAALLIIGDEILSGRTRDANLAFLAGRLSELGIPLREARIVPDQREEIIAALNALRARYSYVFTTGGIGPTHDDITAECVAAAF